MAFSGFCWKKAALIAVGAVIVMALISGWVYFAAEGRKATAKLDGLILERTRLNSRMLTAGQINDTQAKVDHLANKQKERMISWAKLGEKDSDELISRTQAYFELAAFVDKWRMTLAAQGIACEESSRFGFASYAKRSPEEEEIETVLKYMRSVDYVLGILAASGPDRILQVSRERFAGKVRTNDLASDFFEPDPGFIRAQAWSEDSCWIQLKFIGSTQVLREVLNRLAQDGSAGAVRDVLVEQSTLEASAKSENLPAGRLVSPANCRVTLTVEIRHISSEREMP